MEYDRNMWKNIIVERVKDYEMRWQRNGLGMNDTEHEYLQMKSLTKNEKYANGSAGARVRLIVRGGWLPVRSSKGI